MKHIEVSASKGGVGTSTVSVCLAIGLAKTGKKVLLVDMSKHGDCFALIGVSRSSGIVELLDGVSVTHVRTSPLAHDVDKSFDHVIYDAGTDGLKDYVVTGNVYRLAIVPNAYTALRNMMDTLRDYDAMVTVITEDNALNAKDVENVMGLSTLTKMPIKPEISRSIDAGLLTTRYDALIEPWMTPLVKAMKKSTASV
jgi:cellulose biosynthesis protein BcsQ